MHLIRQPHVIFEEESPTSSPDTRAFKTPAAAIGVGSGDVVNGHPPKGEAVGTDSNIVNTRYSVYMPAFCVFSCQVLAQIMVVCFFLLVLLHFFAP